MGSGIRDEVKIFKEARPVFVRGYDGQGNFHAGFTCGFVMLHAGDNVKVRVTVGTFYRLYVNGAIAAHGPARTTEGFLRVDEIDVSRFVKDGGNVFAFEVVHYGEPFGPYSNDVARVPAVLIAEITDGAGNVLSATNAGWKAIVLKQRIRHSERISHCRENAENYILDADYTCWRTDPGMCDAETEEIDCSLNIIKRGMALPDLTRCGGGRIVEFGAARIREDADFRKDWYCARTPEYFKVPMERPAYDYRRTEELPAPRGMRFKEENGANMRITGIGPDETAFVHYDLGKLYLGFISVKVNAASPCVLDIVHLESYSFFDTKNEVAGGANPLTRLHIPAGTTEFTCFEPACVRYIKFYVRPEGDYTWHGDEPWKKNGKNTPEIQIFAPEIIVFITPDTQLGSFQCSDDDVNRLYEAARRTLRLNTLDIFMDCPERERGGWLCDSLWTARAFKMMMGNADVEREFIRNFLQTPPESMWHAFYPESYPGIKGDFKACPGLLTWSFWLMVELGEYVARTGDFKFRDEYKARVEAFVRGTLELRGESGLLENMPWLFIDWSLANEFCRPISTAANALYARMLIDLGELYGNDEWKRLGAEVRSILRKAIAGSDEKPHDTDGFLPDGLEYKDGRLHARGNFSEAGQYTMIWAGLFTREEMPNYIWRLVHTTGADREFECDTRLGKAGLFIGLCIRLDMLSRLGEYDVMFRELKAIYMPQLGEGPGTLWETQDVLNTSRCHGFSAHAGVLLTRDVLGLGEPDEVNKTIKIDPHPLGLRWARGTVNTSDGPVSLSWRKEYGGELKYTLTLPEGWTVSGEAAK
ncbi:MAG: hypothetical protein J5950_06915 [Clostridia bacterium]|nr:hypothetical protein [Clostridia bacterium]